MSEFRRDPVIGRWVIIARDRAKRPMEFAHERAQPRPGLCPFCPGNEHYTPPEIMALRREGTKPNSVGWSVRVVANKFPALQVEGALDKAADGMYDRMNGVGAHEVIIEHPDHAFTLASGRAEQVAEVARVVRDRINDLKLDSRFRFVMVFKNHGREAGASVEHSHTQLIAMPNVPKRVAEELAGAKRYHEWKERCVFCDIISQEIEDGRRLVAENQRFLAIEPYAPRFPFETWVLPKRHQSNFETLDDGDALDLGRIMQSTLARIDNCLDTPPFNLVFHTAPWAPSSPAELLPHYHWHIEIIPKLTNVAGFEWGSGFYINTMPPENAAAFLREAKSGE